MLLQSLQERTGSLRGLNGVVGGGGVEGVKLELQLSGQKWDTLLSLTPISSPPHFNSVAHTRKAAAKIKTSSSDSLSTLRQLFVLFFFFAFGFIRFGWPACTHQPWIMQARPQRDWQVRTEQSIVPAGLQNRNTANTSLNRLMSPCRGQQCTNALVNTHTYTRIHLKKITILKLRVNSWIPR